MDYFDLAGGHGGVLAQAFRAARDTRFCILSISSDWLYPTAESRAVVRALNAAGARSSFVEIESDKGHDAFLLDEPVMRAAVAGFLEAAGTGAGVVMSVAALHTASEAAAAAAQPISGQREDFREILRLVRPGSRVLDVGCGEGVLLEMMTREKAIDGRGLEIRPDNVAACMARGLAVVQGDADRDLDHFPQPRLRLRRPVLHPPASPAIRAMCCAKCFGSPTKPSSPCPTWAIGGCVWRC